MAKERKPLGTAALLGIVVLVTTVVAGSALLFMGAQQDDAPPATFSLSGKDVAEIKQLSHDFMAANTNFGIVTDKVTGNNINDVSYLVGTRAPSGDDYFIPRSQAYSTVEPFLSSNSQLKIDSRLVSAWDSDTERNLLASFEGSDMEIEVPGDGYYTSVYDEQTETVKIPVDFTSTVLTRSHGPVDVWDGTYRVYKKDFKDASVVLTIVKTPSGDWGVYDMSREDATPAFLFTTWTNPEKPYEDLLQNGKEVDPLVPDKKPSEEDRKKLGDTPRNQPTATPTDEE